MCEVVIVAGLRDFLLEYKARTRWRGRGDYGYLMEAGYDIGCVMGQLGHADGRLTMAVYRQSRRRRKYRACAS